MIGGGKYGYTTGHEGHVSLWKAAGYGLREREGYERWELAG